MAISCSFGSTQNNVPPAPPQVYSPAEPRSAIQAIRPTNRKAQTEAVARGKLRRRGLDVPEVIRGHVAHGRPGQEPLAVELPTVRQHVEEARVVHRGPGRTGAARVILRRDRDVVQGDRLAGSAIRRQWLGEALDLVR